MPNRKLGRASDQRSAMLRNLTTALLWNGKIVTTEARAKEIRPIAEKLITLAVKEYKNTVTVEKETRNDKQQVVKVEKVNIMNKQGKLKRQGRFIGRRSATKKAYVQLTPDSKTIEFFEGMAQ